MGGYGHGKSNWTFNSSPDKLTHLIFIHLFHIKDQSDRGSVDAAAAGAAVDDSRTVSRKRKTNQTKQTNFLRQLIERKSGLFKPRPRVSAQIIQLVMISEICSVLFLSLFVI